MKSYNNNSGVAAMFFLAFFLLIFFGLTSCAKQDDLAPEWTVSWEWAEEGEDFNLDAKALSDNQRFILDGEVSIFVLVTTDQKCTGTVEVIDGGVIEDTYTFACDYEQNVLEFTTNAQKEEQYIEYKITLLGANGEEKIKSIFIAAK